MVAGENVADSMYLEFGIILLPPSVRHHSRNLIIRVFLSVERPVAESTLNGGVIFFVVLKYTSTEGGWSGVKITVSLPHRVQYSLHKVIDAQTTTGEGKSRAQSFSSFGQVSVKWTVGVKCGR